MQKTETTINLEDFPKELYYIFEDAKVYDSSSNPTMTVLYSDLGYYVKIAEKDKLRKEAEMAKLFDNIGIGTEVVSYISDDRDYMVTRSARGEDTFIHGDFCLPNVMIDGGEFSSFIDVGLAGVGDRHIDIYWVLWSLNYNLGTDEYTDYFLEQYGRENVDMNILKIVAEVEAQG